MMERRGVLRLHFGDLIARLPSTYYRLAEAVGRDPAAAASLAAASLAAGEGLEVPSVSRGTGLGDKGWVGALPPVEAQSLASLAAAYQAEVLANASRVFGTTSRDAVYRSVTYPRASHAEFLVSCPPADRRGYQGEVNWFGMNQSEGGFAQDKSCSHARLAELPVPLAPRSCLRSHLSGGAYMYCAARKRKK